MRTSMWGWVFWAGVQAFVLPHFQGGYSKFETSLLALLADATVAGAFGVMAVVQAIKATK